MEFLQKSNSSLIDNFINIAGKGNSAAGLYGSYKQSDFYIDARWNDGVGKWKGRNGV